VKKDIVFDSDIGDIITKGNKDYIIINVDFDFGGNVKIIHVVRLYKNWHPMFRFVKEIWDCDLKNYKFK
jgi:hypothetical protein